MDRLYKHFKGGLYRVKNVAYMHDDMTKKEPYVIYQFNDSTLPLYLRKQSEFLEEVKPGVQRFTLVEEV